MQFVDAQDPASAGTPRHIDYIFVTRAFSYFLVGGLFANIMRFQPVQLGSILRESTPGILLAL